MGSSASIIRVEEDEVLAPVPENRRFGVFGEDRNLLENRIYDAALRMWNGKESYMHPGQITAITPVELAQQAIDSVDSFRFAPIVPLMKKADYEIKVKNVSVKLDGSEWAEYMSSNSWGQVIRRKVIEMHPELSSLILSVVVQVPDMEMEDLWRVKKSAGWKVSSTVESDTDGGKAKPVFELVVDGKKLPGGYSTQAQARAEGSKLMKEDMGISEVRVTSRTVREDGSDLVCLSRKITSAVAQVAVSYVKVNKETPESDGFLVFIRYHD